MLIYTKQERPQRREWDHYPTDAETVRTALAFYEEQCDRAPRSVLDVGAGDGVWGREAKKRWPQIDLFGIEARPVTPCPAYDGWSTGDFLHPCATLLPRVDLVLGNPPFRDAEAFVRQGLRLLEPGGTLLYLLRLAFLEARCRRDGLWADLPPALLGVLSRRPSFLGPKSPNPTAYALFLWRRGLRRPPLIVFL